MQKSIVGGDTAAGGGTDRVKCFHAEKFSQIVQVFGRDAGFLCRCEFGIVVVAP